MEESYCFILVGCDGVGKNLIMNKVACNSKEIDLESKFVFTTINRHTCKFTVAESEAIARYPQMCMTSCIVFVYSVTSQNSLEDLSKFTPNLLEPKSELDCADRNSLKILIGNKTDLIDEREVSFEEGQTFSAELNCQQFYEISAKVDSQERILQIFERCIMHIQNDHDQLIFEITMAREEESSIPPDHRVKSEKRCSLS